MEDIKEIAEKYKNENGNKTITNKDLLFYIISRLDGIEKRCNESDKEVATLKSQLKILWLFVPVIAGVILKFIT